MSAIEDRPRLPAVVLIAHDKPRHLHRLVVALAPLPIFLHIDANTNEALFAAMTANLPARVRLLPRLSAGWGHFELAEAELLGYRTALTETQASHVILATGADYPLANMERILEELAAEPTRSYAEIAPLPIQEWGLLRGYDRLVFRQRVWRRRRLAWPMPRRIPRPLRPSGGAQTKILTRRHAQLVLDVLDDRPQLLRFFRSCWTPDEVMIPTLLLSEEFGAKWSEEGSSWPHPWYIDWGATPAKNPQWLGLGDLNGLRAAAFRPGVPALFARKFAEDSDDLVAAVDAGLRLSARLQ
jgi:hypothetical protein